MRAFAGGLIGTMFAAVMTAPPNASVDYLALLDEAMERFDAGLLL